MDRQTANTHTDRAVHVTKAFLPCKKHTAMSTRMRAVVAMLLVCKP